MGETLNMTDDNKNFGEKTVQGIRSAISRGKGYKFQISNPAKGSMRR